MERSIWFLSQQLLTMQIILLFIYFYIEVVDKALTIHLLLSVNWSKLNRSSMKPSFTFFHALQTKYVIVLFLFFYLYVFIINM